MPIAQEKRQAFEQVVKRMISDNVDPRLIREATAKFKQKYDTDSAQITPEPQPKKVYDNSTKIDYPMSYGALPPDVKMSVTPEMQRDAGQFFKPVKFLGDAGQSYTTGVINAPVQAIQDRNPAGIVTNSLKNLATPFANLIGTPFEKPIQTSRESFARAGVPDQPVTTYGTSNADIYAGLTGGIPAIGSDGETLRGQEGEINPAETLGALADYGMPTVAIPLKGLQAIRFAGDKARKGLEGIANPIGKGLKKTGLDQMNRVIPPLMRHERKAKTPINEVIFKYGFDRKSKLPDGMEEAVNNKTMFERSGNKLKELSKELKKRIAEGADNGAGIESHSIIDEAVAELKANRGEDPDFFNYINEVDGVANELKKTTAIASKSGDGFLDLLQAQGFKQNTGMKGKWLQYAKTKGVPTQAKETAESILSETINRKLNDVIDELAEGSTKEINKQISEIIPAHEALGWRNIIDNRKASFSLNDVVGMTASVIDPKAAVVYALAKASKSQRVASWMYRLGEKLEKAKTPEEIIRVTKVLKKSGLTDEQIKSFKIGNNEPFLESMQTGNKLPPRSPTGLPVLDPKPTFVKQEGSFESPFGKPQPNVTEDLELQGWEALDPQNRANLPTGGGGSIEDLYPPEWIARKADEAQASREAYVRQGRERGIGLPNKPFQPAQDPELKVIPRPKAKPKTQKDLFSPQDMRLRVYEMRKYLEGTTKKTPFTSEVMRELEKLGKKPVPKIPEKVKAPFKPKPKRNNFELEGEEGLFLSGHESWPTDKVRAEDAPRTFLVGQREYTKGRTLYGKTMFKDDKGRKFLVKNEDFVHMDKKEDEIPF
jgi:hypothetical protein